MGVHREFIERENFTTTDGGYDPDEVKDHLRQVAAALPEPGQTRSQTLGETTADRVRATLDDAERDAARVRDEARGAAETIRQDADDKAQQAIHKAVAQREDTRRAARQLKLTLKPPEGELKVLRQKAAAGERQLTQLKDAFDPALESARGLRERAQSLHEALTTLAQTRSEPPAADAQHPG